ncbi:MAG: acetyl-CoA carboxylase biotin carboxyl carrier protein subunit [Candidatus Eiseniibacteriota bacterium]
MLKHLVVDGRRHDVTISVDGDGLALREGERTIRISERRWEGARLTLRIAEARGDRTIEAHVLRGRSGRFDIWLDGERHIIEEERRAGGGGSAGGAAPGDDDLLTAPMPAKVVKVEVAAGDAVEEGQALLVLESMKMELGVTSPRAGTVKRVAVAAGQIITAGTELVELERVSS